MPRSLTKLSAIGIAWLLAQAAGQRVVTFLAQIVLARLLRPTDFGSVALAASVSAIMVILVGFGIDDVIVSRARHFRMWVTPAIWASLAFSLLGVVCLVSFAPIAAHLYHSNDILGMLLISAATLPLGAFASITDAFLRSEMRFRFISIYTIVELAAVQLATVILAWRGFGAFSFVIPLPFAAAIKCAVFWKVAKLRPNWRLRWLRIRTLIGSGAAVFGTKLVIALRNNGDYILLGMLATHVSVGLYFMAFRLAALPVYAFANSLTGVLYPALTKLQSQPERQLAAALSASRIIAVVVIPISFLQAAISGSLIHFLFGEKWMGSAPMLSILSVGLAFDVVPCVASALLSANGKFKTLWYWAVGTIPLFFLAIGVGSFLHQAEGVAVGVSVYFVVIAPAFTYFTLRPSGCSLQQVAGIYLPPTVCASAAVALGRLVSRLPAIQNRDFVLICAICACTLAAYACFVRLLSPAAAKDTINKFSVMWGRAA